MAHTDKNLLRYVGDTGQLCGSREYELTSGARQTGELKEKINILTA